ncbi:hypothetical protein H4R18_004171 [Coemansia javaensis]|uniref:NAD-dependent epimerase/dehydratase domain-containing protein n=1 Tax=Coemansia javaensis TaxID=2761396 RepID=A0A9W8H4Y9_9FUNG|nr:hypothetical protein H4R18_004171 [Coemansia javaensis]
MPAYLVLGCTNFYGRALVQQLCADRDAAGGGGADWVIRGVDKALPQLASLPEATLQLFATLDYRMGNLRRAEFLEQAFARGGAGRWDAVFNFAAEHKFGQSAGVYEQDVHQLSVAVARLAAKHAAGALVQLSTAHVYAPGAGRSSEDGAVEAADELAACHLRAEADIRAIAGLPPLVVLRPALCYGPGDRQNVVPMLISALLSREAGEPMPVLWAKDLRVNTVHVADVARAAVLAAGHARAAQQPVSVFNLSDPGDTTNAALAQAVAGLFGVGVSFQSSAVNFIAKRLRTEELAEEVNESLLGPWMDLLARHNAANSPLSPYLDREHPYFRLEHRPLAVDGSRIEAADGLGFRYLHRSVSADALRPIVAEFRQLGLWPDIDI